MLATTGAAPATSAAFVYEPKYDGIRALVSIEPAPGGPSVHLLSRLGNDKSQQFSEITAAVRAWARTRRRALLLDGEIVALGEHGEPISFGHLQARMHRKAGPVARPGSPPPNPAALLVFDILRDGNEDWRQQPLRSRRTRLEQLLSGALGTTLRLAEQVSGDARTLLVRARTEGWEGLMCKQADSIYVSGRRSTDWRKMKLNRRQSCVVGGWTDPRGTRARFGALILGVYDDRGRLCYVGHAGSGFSDAELERVWTHLAPLQTRRSPFGVAPPTNERPHWVRPGLVADVKFTEWTKDGILRHPTYLGLRDDVDASRIRREPDTLVTGGLIKRAGLTGRQQAPAAPRPAKASGTGPSETERSVLLGQLDAIEQHSGNGWLMLPDGDRLRVTNLAKVFWPAVRGQSRRSRVLTKGDLLRHYVRVAPFILPVLAERPLVMKRHPNGVDGKAFYQHRAPEPLPPGVRVQPAGDEVPPRDYLIGGSLKALLYTAQLASISQDPWFSRVGSPEHVDYVALDLDPPEGQPFGKILDLARWIRDELDTLGTPAFPKTSGASGLHIYIPLPSHTPYEAGQLFCQIVATVVASKHPKAATVERAVAARGRRIYVDYLQNAFGKTLASAYSARASTFAGVSTPVTWDEIDAGVSPRDYTVPTIAARLDAIGDLWAALRASKGADLRAVARLVGRP